MKRALFAIVGIVIFLCGTAVQADYWVIRAHVACANCPKSGGETETDLQAGHDRASGFPSKAECLLAMRKLEKAAADNQLTIDAFCEKVRE
jgi:hypothetical protein